MCVCHDLLIAAQAEDPNTDTQMQTIAVNLSLINENGLTGRWVVEQASRTVQATGIQNQVARAKVNTQVH